MDLRASLSLLVLLMGLSQAVHLMVRDNFLLEEPETVDITTRILDSNNASTELLVEGDLIVPRTRNALNCWNNYCLWRKSSNGIVEVPYILSSDFSYYDKLIIDNAMAAFHRTTCIRFVPLSSQYDYISIENRDGCFSSLGRTGGMQVLSLNRQGCVYHGIVQHEINHALGFYHEQTRSDRDQYVRINWDYISPSMIYNFYKQNTNNLYTPYDYSSIMHYGRTAFAVQYGVETITPIPDASVQIGQRQGLSDIDIQRINLLYGCCE
ncbi:high choriolytic enzyme 1-like [Chanos chanos]|uniref:Metalloendopeptidase n=1 Tax=Chanos chanos TaxID=29144 RepID=A0A6J2WW32_CHACN|nr:high choriolytic enzyme 1-like [Chanos chanos]XP_030648431.1 high choriolytic enzyme 1-like [Chanos chanos]